MQVTAMLNDNDPLPLVSQHFRHFQEKRFTCRYSHSWFLDETQELDADVYTRKCTLDHSTVVSDELVVEQSQYSRQTDLDITVNSALKV